MRKILILFLALLLMISNIATAQDTKPNIAVIYSDEYSDLSKSTKAEHKQIFLAKLNDTFSQNYNIIINDSNTEKLFDMGLTDFLTAERADVINALPGYDYIVLIDIPRRTKKTGWFEPDKITSFLHLKIIDVNNNKTLYNGKFQYTSKWASPQGHSDEL